MNLNLNVSVDNRRPVQAGFTLLEILIALFIFTIVSMILASALHTIINSLSGAEASAERLRKMQMVLLVMSRDIEQTANRPILDSAGNEEVAFLGTPRSFTFTHLGFATLAGNIPTGGMQRTQYVWDRKTLWRKTWEAVDLPPQAKPFARALLPDVIGARFQYLDGEGRFQDTWPVEGQTGQTAEPLPRAVRISLNIANWGTLTQLYVISAQSSKNFQTPGSTPPPQTQSQQHGYEIEEP